MPDKTARIFTRITPALNQRFNVKAASLGLKRPDAVEQAIHQWTDVPKSEQTIICPACESTLSVVPELPVKVLERKSVPFSEQFLKTAGIGVESPFTPEAHR